MAITFPVPRPISTIQTQMIRLTRNELQAAHSQRGQFVVVTGTTGGGKTTTAQYLSREISGAFQRQPDEAHRFDARYYVSTDHRHTRNGSTELLQRRVLAEFAMQVLDLTPPRDVRQMDLPSYMKVVANALDHEKVQMVFIDEASHLPVAALECLANLLNVVATTREKPLTIVLVGMSALMINVKQAEHVARRATTWVQFRPYTPTEVLEVLRPIDPFFAALQEGTVLGDDVVSFLRQPEVSQGGMIGFIVPLAEQAARHAKVTGKPMSLNMLRIAHALKAASQAMTLSSGTAKVQTQAQPHAAPATARRKRA